MFVESVATCEWNTHHDPPERAVVLCVDEKSQIQALDRTQPGLPLKKGRAATMTHDYKMEWLPPSPDGIAMCQGGGV